MLPPNSSRRLSWAALRAALGAFVVVASLTTGPVAADSGPRASKATLSILNAVADDRSFALVDVYADRVLAAEDLEPGELGEVELKPGRYEITVVPAGRSRISSAPLLDETSVRLSAGQNRTVALHLSPRGKATSTVFTNRTRTVGRDMGQLTFRHIAQAPDVDIRTRGSVLMDSVTSGQQAGEGLRSGTYRIRVVEEGTRDKLLPASNHRLYNAPGRQDMGDNRIVYLWGSADDDSLRLAVHEIALDLN